MDSDSIQKVAHPSGINLQLAARKILSELSKLECASDFGLK